MKQKNNGSRPLTAFYFPPPPPPPKKRTKQNKTKQQKKAETKTEKKNKETKQSTTMEHLLTRGNFFACNLSRNFATSWEVWRNY